jgi:BCD family chlorophyll transporter-like MFS transporter
VELRPPQLPHLGWLGIARLGLVQASLGAVVVLATGTLNRLMVVEMGLPALVPGLLIAWHYLIQILRPRLGHGSDQGGRRIPWILGGIVMLALGAVGAAAATTMMRMHPVAGVLLALIDYSFIGVGVGCTGTALLVLLAQRTAPERRPAAATLVWIMMIAGFVVTAAIAGQALEPYSSLRLLQVVGSVALCAVVITTLSIWGMEGPTRAGALAAGPTALDPVSTDAVGAPIGVPATPAEPRVSPSSVSGASTRAGFMAALREVWSEPQARRFAAFVFIAMLAYSAQELLLDPFAGAVYGYTPGASTRLSGVQHGGALVGMLLVALLGTLRRGQGLGSPRVCTVAGCAASAAMLVLIASSAVGHFGWPLRAMVFALGVANGGFAVSAIASMMQMVGQGARQREGVRMGLWGAAQAVAFAAGGVSATGLSDLARLWWTDPGVAYGLVFFLQAGLFVTAAILAQTLWRPIKTADLAPQGRGALAGSR